MIYIIYKKPVFKPAMRWQAVRIVTSPERVEAFLAAQHSKAARFKVEPMVLV